MQFSEFSELTDVLEQLKFTNNAHFDPFLDQLRSKSPVPVAGDDLDGSQEVGEVRNKQSVNKKKLQEKKVPPKMKVITFDKSNSVDCRFEKSIVSPEDARKTKASSLAAALGPLNKKEAPDLQAGNIPLTIFLPSVATADNPKPKIGIKVSDTCTVDQCVAAILKQYEKQDLQPPLLPSPSCYELRMADVDGTPEIAIGLQKGQQIAKFGEDTFVLCEIPGASANVTPDQNRRNLRRFSQQGLFLIRVHMSKNSSNVYNYTVEMTLKDLLLVVAKKKKIVPENFCFKRCIEDAQDSDTPLDLNVKVESLDSDEIRLVEKQFADAPVLKSSTFTPVEEGEGVLENAVESSDFIFTEASASQYKEYEVIKMNRYGTRQPRIMGIDRERIYNHAPRAKNQRSSGFLNLNNLKNVSKKATKKPFRLVEDVAEIEVGSKPQFFHIHFRDGDSTALYEYEAKDQYDCGEIIAKIRFLMSLIKR